MTRKRLSEIRARSTIDLIVGAALATLIALEVAIVAGASTALSVPPRPAAATASLTSTLPMEPR